jgi:hypothetical protein
MKIIGVVVNEENKETHYLSSFPAGVFVKTSQEVKTYISTLGDFFTVEGVTLEGNSLVLTSELPRYRIEGWDKLKTILKEFQKRSALSKELAGIDEEEVELKMQNGLSIHKSYRDGDYFTEYDYEENGYNDAQFTGWESIRELVSKQIGVPKEAVWANGGEKLWFGVEVDCKDFAKLIRL